MIVQIENCKDMIQRARRDIDNDPRFEISFYFFGIIDAIHHNGVDAIIVSCKADPEMDPNGKDYKLQIPLEELEKIMGSDAFKELRSKPQEEVEHMKVVRKKAEERLDRERKKIVNTMDAMREKCVHYIPGSQEARRYIYCTHPDRVDHIKQHPESEEVYTSCCPQTCKSFQEKTDDE